MAELSDPHGLTSLVRTEFRNLPFRELLNQSPTVLLGVTPAAATSLGKLDINTVFDLATSSIFDDAAKLVEAAQDRKNVLNLHGSAPSDLVDATNSAGCRWRSKSALFGRRQIAAARHLVPHERATASCDEVG
ncbi:hypothetical protein [Paraburkholderia kururiensis]|uniref:hypothetical protein n=1 Tax=Paraburkholderia kururiensis TaxID=984307 RepID=UPI000F87F36B|nr:hypothetical protein [Paraburkholderia kururiensis]